MLAQLFAGVVLLYFFWLVARRYIFRSSLYSLPGPPRTSFWTGNLSQIYHTNAWQFHRDIVEQYGGAIKLHGWFGSEQVYLSDPKALHHVLVKDQYIYEETSWFIAYNKLVFGTSIISTLGDHHRKQRKLLNPVFSINHMRNLIPVFYPISHRLRDAVAAQVTRGAPTIDMLHWISRAALEYIGQAGLGYSFDSLDPQVNNQNEYSKSIKDFGPVAMRLALPQQLIPFLVKLAPPSILRAAADLMPWKLLHQFLGICDVMHATSVEVFEKKKAAFHQGDKAVVHQVGQGKDIMSVLMRANMMASEEDRLPEDELLGQMNTFIFAGSDTTSSALARTLQVLSSHPEAQARLRAEVTEARRLHGDLEYDELINLPYLDAVCRETLRLFTPVPQLARTVRKDMILPLATPIKATDGKTDIRELFLKEGTGVIISLAAVNRDKSIWGPDADEWKPERWLSPLPSSVSDAHLPGIYSNLMTFSGGARSCIGFKFSQLEMKVVLSVLVESFVFEPVEDEIVWLMAVVASPSVKGKEHMVPHLPMKVSFVDDVNEHSEA